MKSKLILAVWLFVMSAFGAVQFIDYTTVYSPATYTNYLKMTIPGMATNVTVTIITTNSQIGDSLPTTAQKLNANFSFIISNNLPVVTNNAFSTLGSNIIANIAIANAGGGGGGFGSTNFFTGTLTNLQMILATNTAIVVVSNSPGFVTALRGNYFPTNSASGATNSFANNNGAIIHQNTGGSTWYLDYAGHQYYSSTNLTSGWVTQFGGSPVPQVGAVYVVGNVFLQLTGVFTNGALASTNNLLTTSLRLDGVIGGGAEFNRFTSLGTNAILAMTTNLYIEKLYGSGTNASLYGTNWITGTYFYSNNVAGTNSFYVYGTIITNVGPVTNWDGIYVWNGTNIYTNGLGSQIWYSNSLWQPPLSDIGITATNLPGPWTPYSLGGTGFSGPTNYGFSLTVPMNHVVVNTNPIAGDTNAVYVNGPLWATYVTAGVGYFYSLIASNINAINITCSNLYADTISNNLLTSASIYADVLAGGEAAVAGNGDFGSLSLRGQPIYVDTNSLPKLVSITVPTILVSNGFYSSYTNAAGTYFLNSSGTLPQWTNATATNWAINCRLSGNRGYWTIAPGTNPSAYYRYATTNASGAIGQYKANTTPGYSPYITVTPNYSSNVTLIPITNFSLTATGLVAGAAPTAVVTGVTNNVAYVILGIPAGAPGTNFVTVNQFTNVMLTSQQILSYSTNPIAWGTSNFLARVNGIYDWNLYGGQLGGGGLAPPTNVFIQACGSYTGTNAWFVLTNGFYTTNTISISATGPGGGVGYAYLYSIDHWELFGRTNAFFGQYMRFDSPKDSHDAATKNYVDNAIGALTGTMFQATNGQGITHYVYQPNGVTIADFWNSYSYVPIASMTLDGSGNVLMNVIQTNLQTGYTVVSTTNITFGFMGFQTYTNYTLSTNAGVVTFTMPINYSENRFWRINASSGWGASFAKGTTYPSNTWNLAAITNSMSPGDIITVNSNGLKLVDVWMSNSTPILKPHW